MIFVTGDTHGEIDLYRLSEENFPESKIMGKEDYLIILGDFGLPFLPSDVVDDKNNRESRMRYLRAMEWLRSRPYTVLWLDGNHDNHPFWYGQPTVEWNSGMVNIHPLAENVIHLKRGEYYTVDGKTFWVMGGAKSQDKAYRTEGYSWWREEIPSMAEMQHGMDTLEAHGNKADFILTHTMPQSLIAPILRTYFPPEPTTSYLDQVYRDTDFGYWYCGHMHQDVDHSGYRLRVLYYDIARIC